MTIVSGDMTDVDNIRARMDFKKFVLDAVNKRKEFMRLNADASLKFSLTLRSESD